MLAGWGGDWRGEFWRCVFVYLSQMWRMRFWASSWPPSSVYGCRWESPSQSRSSAPSWRSSQSLSLSVPLTHTHACTHAHTRMHARMHTHTRTHTHTGAHTHAHTHACTHMHAHTHHTHTQVHTCTHARTHTHTHTHRHLQPLIHTPCLHLIHTTSMPCTSAPHMPHPHSTCHLDTTTSAPLINNALHTHHIHTTDSIRGHIYMPHPLLTLHIHTPHPHYSFTPHIDWQLTGGWFTQFRQTGKYHIIQLSSYTSRTNVILQWRPLWTLENCLTPRLLLFQRAADGDYSEWERGWSQGHWQVSGLTVDDAALATVNTENDAQWFPVARQCCVHGCSGQALLLLIYSASIAIEETYIFIQTFTYKRHGEE